MLSLGNELDSAVDYDISIDLIVLNKAPYYIAHEALKGEVVFSRDNEKLTDIIEQVNKDYLMHGYYKQKGLEEKFGSTT